MKKIIYIFYGLCFFFSPAFGQELGIKEENAQVKRQINGLELLIDGRMELLTVIQFLSNHWTISTEENSYYDAIKDYFMPFTGHEIVELTKKTLLRNGHSAEKPYTMMLAIDHSFEPYDCTRERLAKLISPDPATVALFLNCMKQFVEESRFWLFFEKNKSFYDSILDEQIKTLTRFDGIFELQNFYGEKHDSYTIIIKPLDYASYGLSIPNAENKDKVCFVYGFPEGNPQKIDSEVNFTNLFWHEFGHTFVNSITASFPQKVESTKYLYAPISKVNYSYPNWKTAINEQIIRAITTYLTFEKFGKEAGDQILRKEQRVCFLYTEGLLPLLRNYQQNRDIYPTFREYFPCFMTQFAALKPDNDTQLIKSKGVLSLDSAYVIIPTLNNSSEQALITKNIEQCLEREFPKASFTFISDKTALKKDLSAFPIIAFGSINANNNEWINQCIHTLPFKFEDNCIIAGEQRINGDHLRMFTAFRNPQNKKQDALLFLALNPIDLIDIAELELLFPSFAIYENETIKCSGTYKFENNTWKIDDVSF